MSTQFESANPYASPTVASYAPPVQRERAPASVLGAGMALIAVASLGLAISVFNFAYSFGAPHVDPKAPAMVQEIQKGTVGPMATAIQGTFAMLNLFIIICGVQMMKLQSWGMAVAGSILAIVNIGGCCCIVGLPVGIWSLSVLMSPDVISIFSAAKAQQ
jgi:hypothetical protein